MCLVTSVMGESIVPHLIQVIEEGSWGTKFSAATCFSLLTHSKAAESALIGLIKKGQLNYDARRAVVEALGIIGADWCASYLIKYLKYGLWIEDPNEYHIQSSVDKDHIAKLYSYVIPALAKFAAKSTDHNVSHTIFEYLADLITQKELNCYSFPGMLITSIGHEFTPCSIDALINIWGNSEHEILQELCCEILGYIAPVRAAQYLLNKASSPATPDVIRRAASIALGEIRHPLAAEKLAIKLKHSGTDQTYLDWAFSTLYALPADWSGLSDYVDELLAYDNEQGCQLRYSLALKRDGRCQTTLVEYLDHHKPYIRWTSALALARLLGPNSRKYLDQRFEEASNVLERCGLYAAVIHAGNYEEVGALHKGLCELETFSSLRSVWKLEMLDAFRIVHTFDDRAFRLWAKVSKIGQRQLEYFIKLVP